MPRDGYSTITLPDDLIDRLDGLRYADGTNASSNQPQRSYAEVIRELLGNHEKPYRTERYDGSDGVEVVRIDQGVINDISAQVSTDVLSKFEERF